MKIYEFTTERPNGEIEKTKGKFPRMTKNIFDQIVTATKKAGSGNVMSYVEVATTFTPSPVKRLTVQQKDRLPCPRCGTYCFGDCTS